MAGQQPSVSADATASGASAPQRHAVQTDTTGVFKIPAKVDVALQFMYLDPSGLARFFPPTFEHGVRIVYQDGSVETYRADMRNGIVTFETPRANGWFTIEFVFDEPLYIVNEPLGRNDARMNALRDRAKAEEYAFPPKAMMADIANVRVVTEKQTFDKARQQAREKAEAEQKTRTPNDAKAIQAAGEQAAKDYVISDEDRRRASEKVAKQEQKARKYYEDNGPPPWHRVFELPKKITLKNADWKIEHKQYDPARFCFDLKKDKPRQIGTKNVPVTLTLDPHWQYVKFEYFDRYFGHSDHGHKPISVLPQMLEGYDGEPGKLDAAADSRKDKWKTRSNWVIGKDDKLENAVQCIPWIIQRSDDGATAQPKPDDNTTLAFFTEEDYRWIKALEKDKRVVLKLDSGSDDAKPSADRLRWYDLPAVWKSRKFWCRWSDKEDEQDLYEEMAKKVAAEHKDKKASKDQPLIFCLDDIVLTRENAGEFLPLTIDPNDRPLVFYHEFKRPPAGEGGRPGSSYTDIGGYKPGLRRGPALIKARDDAKAKKKAELEKKARDDAERAKRSELEAQARAKAETEARQEEERKAQAAIDEKIRLDKEEAAKSGRLASAAAWLRNVRAPWTNEAATQVANDAQAQARIKQAGDKAVKDLAEDRAAQQKIKEAGDQAVSDLAVDPSATSQIDTAGTEAHTEQAGKEDAASGFPYSDIVLRGSDRNYIADYPHWTRLVIVAGNMFDVFDKRTEQDLSKADNADRPVGARAAVRWVNAATSDDGGVGVAPGTIRPDCDRVNQRFFAIQPFYKQQFEDGKIGRFDMAAIRCCGRDGDTELGLNLQYYRLFFNYDAAPAKYKPADPAHMNNRATLAANAVEGITTRWTGPDGGSNARRAEIVVATGTPKFKAEVVWFAQNIKEAHAHFRIGFMPETGRSWMAGGSGRGEMREKAAANDGSRGFVMAHECGHGGSLPDEYPEKSDRCSYGFQSIESNGIPGDVYDYDEDDPMMNYNNVIRGRYHWHAAEFFHCLYGDDYKLVHGHGGTTYDFRIPSHANHAHTAAAQPPVPKTHVYWPLKTVQNADIGQGKFDVHFFALGKDAYSQEKLKAGHQFDGLVCVHLRIHLDFDPDDTWTNNAGDVKGTWGLIQDRVGKIHRKLNQRFNWKFFARGQVNGENYDKCLVLFRFGYLIWPATTENVPENLDHLENYSGSTPADRAAAYGGKFGQLSGDPGYHMEVSIDPGHSNAWSGDVLQVTPDVVHRAIDGCVANFLGLTHTGAYPVRDELIPIIEKVMDAGVTMGNL